MAPFFIARIIRFPLNFMANISPRQRALGYNRLLDRLDNLHMDINNGHSLYRVQIDLVGFAGNTFLDGWSMTQKNLQKFNSALAGISSYPFVGVASVVGSISNEDDNTEGDNKVYIAVEALSYQPSEAAAIAAVLNKVVDPLLVALPARGGFDMDGDADCLDSGLANLQDVETLIAAMPTKMAKAVKFMRDSSHIPIVA